MNTKHNAYTLRTAIAHCKMYNFHYTLKSIQSTKHTSLCTLHYAGLGGANVPTGFLFPQDQR